MLIPGQSLIAAAGAALCLALPYGAVAQTDKPVCDLVTEQDAAALIGSVLKKQSTLGPDQCVFTTKGLSLMINRLPDQEPEQMTMMLELPKHRARPGDVVKEEPGIGQLAVSETSKGRLNIIAASGTTIWTLGVDHVYSQDLTEMLPRLRELARKLAGGPQK
jgi:hypothetical protein